MSYLNTEPPECVYAGDGAAPIAYKHIEDPVVPPALGEVWQLMLKGVLQEFKHHGDN